MYHSKIIRRFPQQKHYEIPIESDVGALQKINNSIYMWASPNSLSSITKPIPYSRVTVRSLSIEVLDKTVARWMHWESYGELLSAQVLKSFKSSLIKYRIMDSSDATIENAWIHTHSNPLTPVYAERALYAPWVVSPLTLNHPDISHLKIYRVILCYQTTTCTHLMIHYTSQPTYICVQYMELNQLPESSQIRRLGGLYTSLLRM